MKAMVLYKQAPIESEPLAYSDIDKPELHERELLLKVICCGICRTDLHIVESELPLPNLPIILGHQVVAIVDEVGKDVNDIKKSERVGVPWLMRT